MSTAVNKRSARIRRPGADTRLRILEAASLLFSGAGYEAVGLRQIATEADTDPTITLRLFGSKAALFEEAAAAVLAGDDIFDAPRKQLDRRLADHLMAPAQGIGNGQPSILGFILHSAASPTAAPILAGVLQKALLDPLEEKLGAPDGAARSVLVVSLALGLATMRFALGVDMAGAGARERLHALLAVAIRDWTDGETG